MLNYSDKYYKFVGFDNNIFFDFVFYTKKFDGNFVFYFKKKEKLDRIKVIFSFDFNLNKFIINTNEVKLKLYLYNHFKYKLSNDKFRNELSYIYKIINENGILRFYYTFYLLFNEYFDYNYYIFLLFGNLEGKKYRDVLSFIENRFINYEIISTKFIKNNLVESIVFKDNDDKSHIYKLNCNNLGIGLYKYLFKGINCFNYNILTNKITNGIYKYNYLLEGGNKVGLKFLVKKIIFINKYYSNLIGKYNHGIILNDFNEGNYILVDNGNIKIIDLEQIVYDRIFKQIFLFYLRNEKKFCLLKLQNYIELFLCDKSYYDLFINIDYSCKTYYNLAMNNSFNDSFLKVSGNDILDLLKLLKNKYEG